MAKIPTFIFWGQSNMRGKGIIGELEAARPSQYPLNYYGKFPNWYWWYSDWTAKNPSVGSVVEMDFQPSRLGTDAGFGTGAFDGVSVLTDTTREWPTNLLAGSLITFAGGAATIISNTATTITMGSFTIGPPAAATGLNYIINNAVFYGGVTNALLVQLANGGWRMTFAAIAGLGVNQIVGYMVIYNSTYYGIITANTATTIDVATFGSTAPPLNVGLSFGAYRINRASHPIVDAQPQSEAYAAFFGPAVPTSWRLMTELQVPILVLNLGIDSAYISRVDSAPRRAAVSWFDAGAHKSFAPTFGNGYGDGLTSQQSLSRILMEYMLPAANTAVVALGYEGVDVQGINSLIGESEGIDSWRATQAGNSMQNVLTYMEQKIDAGGYSSLEGVKIPKVIGGIRVPSIFPYAETVMQQYEALAATSRYIRCFRTDDLAIPDGAHYTTSGVITIGDRFFDAWNEIRAESDSALEPQADRPTLAELRTKVLRRYERNTNSSDTQAPLVNQLLNDSIREFNQFMGDAAWYLLRIETFTLAVIPGVAVTLPQPIMRVHRIEDPNQPGVQVVWKEIGYTSQGRLQIILDQIGSGTYNIHHLYNPRDLTGDGDLAPFPRQYEEAVILLTLRRMAETSNNDVQISNYARQAADMMTLLKNDAKSTARQKQPRIDALGDFTPYGMDSWRSFDSNVYGRM